MVTDDHSEVLSHSTDGHLSLSGPRLLVWGASPLSESVDASISFRTVFLSFGTTSPQVRSSSSERDRAETARVPLAKSFVAQKVGWYLYSAFKFVACMVQDGNTDSDGTHCAVDWLWYCV